MGAVAEVGLATDVPLVLRLAADISLGPVDLTKSVKSRMDPDCTLASLASLPSCPLLRFSLSADRRRGTELSESLVVAGVDGTLFAGGAVCWFEFVIVVS